MNVLCDVEEITLESENGTEIDSVSATCSKCGCTEESYGDGEASIKRCLVMLRENCPVGENNFYVENKTWKALED